MANVPTTSWDETSPAGSQSILLGDNRIREFKTQVREVIGVDHDFPSSGQDTDVGQHLRVTLQEQADLGSGAVGTTILGSQTISGKGELVYTDEDDTDIQLTSGGKVCLNTVSLASVAGLMALIYPVGSVVTLGVSTNPATLFGIGTWTAIAGKVIVGIDATQTEFDTLNETGGSKSSEHTHTGTTNALTGSLVRIDDNSGGSDYDWMNPTSHTHTFTTASGGSTNGNLPPYIVKYVWQRTA